MLISHNVHVEVREQLAKSVLSSQFIRLSGRLSSQWNILQAQYYQLLLLGTLLLHNLCLMLDSSTFHLVYSATYLKQQLSNIQTSHSFLNTLALKSGPFPDDKHYPNPPIHFYPYTKTTRKCDFVPTKLHCVAKIIINETQNYLQEKRII